MRYFRLMSILSALAFAVSIFLITNNARAATAAEINRDAKMALGKLYVQSPAAKTLAGKSEASWSFPPLSREASFWVEIMVKALFLRVEKRPGTTIPFRSHTGCRPAYRNMGMHCFS